MGSTSFVTAGKGFGRKSTWLIQSDAFSYTRGYRHELKVEIMGMKKEKKKDSSEYQTPSIVFAAENSQQQWHISVPSR